MDASALESLRTKFKVTELSTPEEIENEYQVLIGISHQMTESYQPPKWSWTVEVLSKERDVLIAHAPRARHA